MVPNNTNNNQFHTIASLGFTIYCVRVFSGQPTYILVEVSFYISTTWWVSLPVEQLVPDGTCSQVLRSTSVDSYLLRASKFFLVKIVWNCNCVGLLHHPFWLQLFLERLGDFFWSFENTFSAKDHWWVFSTRNAHMVHIVNYIRFKMVYLS